MNETDAPRDPKQPGFRMTAGGNRAELHRTESPVPAAQVEA